MLAPYTDTVLMYALLAVLIITILNPTLQPKHGAFCLYPSRPILLYLYLAPREVHLRMMHWKFGWHWMLMGLSHLLCTHYRVLLVLSYLLFTWVQQSINRPCWRNIPTLCVKYSNYQDEHLYSFHSRHYYYSSVNI